MVPHSVNSLLPASFSNCVQNALKNLRKYEQVHLFLEENANKLLNWVLNKIMMSFSSTLLSFNYRSCMKKMHNKVIFFLHNVKRD